MNELYLILDARPEVVAARAALVVLWIAGTGTMLPRAVGGHGSVAERALDVLAALGVAGAWTWATWFFLTN